MFDRILVGLKEGAPAEPLIDLASQVAEPAAEIVLATFVMVGTDADEAVRLKEAEQQLAHLAEPLAVRNFTVVIDASIRAAAAGAAIVQSAEERGSRLIVIGLAKRTRVGKALMGSDAQRVLLQAACPVLTMRLPG